MATFNWQCEVGEDLVRMERIIDESLQTRVPLLREMALYLVESGGKRIRPGVTMTIYRALGGDEFTNQLRLAASFELLHTGTLVHDDVNDDSDYRRGKKAIHVKYGIQNAIITGDYLFAKSFQMGAKYGIDVVQKLMEVCVGLAEGEIIQRKWIDGEKMSVADRIEIIDLKTALPIAGMAWAGAYTTRFRDTMANKAFDFGLNLGRAFQLKDDLMDILGDPDKTGKPLLQDLEQGNITLPVTYALEKLKGSELDRLNKIVLNPTLSDPAEYRTLIENSGALDFIAQRMAHYSELCTASLTGFPDNRYTDSLNELVGYVSARSN